MTPCPDGDPGRRTAPRISPLAALALAAALTACRGPGDSPPAPRFSAGVTRVVLDNGMTVLARELHESPVVTAMIWYRFGSADESAGDSGVAHVLEHMMFKGTDQYPKATIDHHTQRNGGRNNAFTAEDTTAYFFDFASDRWTIALDIESSRMRGCLLDEKEFQSERQVVLEEIRRRLDTPWERIEQEIERRIFPGHAYAHPVIGWPKDVEGLTRDRMASYYNRRYVPNNAVLVLSGDFDTAEALDRVRARFGGIPRGPEVPARAGAPAEPVRDHAVELESPHQLDRLMIAFRAPAFRAPDDAAVDVVATILGDGRSSRLYRRLVESAPLVSEISCSAATRRVSGLFTIMAEILPGKGFDAVEKAVGEELARLAREPVPARELEKAQNRLAAQFVFSKETAHGVASALGWFEVMGAYDYVDAYFEKVRRTTAEDVRIAAERCFRDEGRVVGRSKAAPRQQGLRPAPKPDGMRPPVVAAYRRDLPGLPIDAEGRRSGSDACRPGIAPPPAPVFDCPASPRIDALKDVPAASGAVAFQLPPIRREVLPNGLVVLALRRPGSPAFALRAFVDAGPLVEPEAKAGVARLVSELLLEGTASRTGPEMAEAIEFVGGSLDSLPDGLNGRVLSKDADLLLALAADAIRSPSFPADVFDRVKAQTLAAIAGEDDQPAIVARKRFKELVYGTHPLHRPSIGYRQTVEALTREDVLRHHAAYYRPRNAIVSVVGDESQEALVERVRRHFGGWADTGPARRPAIPAVSRQTAPRRDAVLVESAQAHLVLGHLGIRRSDPDYHTLLVMDHVLGVGAGFTDRLSRRIRDELGLAYEVHGTIAMPAGVEPGTFQVYIGTRHEKVDESLRETRALLDRFVAEGPTEDEARDAKAYLLGSYVFDYETAQELATYLITVERYGLGLDYLQNYPSRIAAVTREAIARAARAHLDPAHMTTVVGGKPPAK
jgi:zinc protease